MPYGLSRRALALAVVVSLTAACSQDPKELTDNAARFEQAGDYNAAVIELKSAVRLAPEDGTLRFALGKLYNRMYNDVAAEKELRAARRLGVSAVGQVELELARSLRAQGKFQALIDDIAVPDEAPIEDKAALIALRGRAEHALGHREEAQEALARAREIAPDAPDAALLDAQILAGKRDFAGALALIDKLLERVPDQFDAWTYKAELLRATRREEDAVAAYTKVLKMNPRHFASLVNRSSLLVGQGKLEDAAKDVQVLLKNYRGHPRAQVQKGILALANGQAREALDAALAALKVAPKLPSAMLLAGTSSYSLGLYEQAEQQLNAHVAASPADAYARRVLGETLVALQQPARALEILKPLLDQGSDDVRVYSAAASAATALGDKARASQFFEKAASITPDNANLQIQRSIAMIGSGDEVGIDELQAALSESKDPTRADEYLILTLLQQGEVDKAWDAVQALEKRAPGTAIAANLRGVVLMARGEIEAGRLAFEEALKVDPTFLPAARNLVQFDLGGGNVDAARGRYAAVIKANEQELPPRMALGELEIQLRDTAAAMATYEAAMKLAPEALEPRKKLVALYLTAGDAAKALELATPALDKNPSDAQLILLTAQAQQTLGNANQADETMRRLISQFPDNDQAAIRVADFQAAAGRAPEAVRTLEMALRNRPKSPELRVALVSQLVSAGRFDEALKLAEEAKAAQPKAPAGDLLEGEVREAQKDFAAAAASYRQALEKQAVGLIAVKLFLAEARGGDVEGAFGRLQGWADKHPADAVARAQIGNVLLARGDYKGAAAQYELVIATKEVTLEVLNNLALAYQALNDERALQYGLAAQQAAPNSPMVADTLGWIYFQRGDTPQAVAQLQRAALLAPDTPEIQYHLAAAQHKAGNVQAAKAALEKALAATDKFPSRAAAQELMGKL